MDDDIYPPICDDDYFAQFGIGKEDESGDRKVENSDKLKTAYTRACQRCENEYTLHWMRAGYFWGLIAVIFTGYTLLYSSNNDKCAALPLDFYLLLLGLIFSFAWLLVIKGSAFWHKNWEIHIKKLESYIAGDIDKTIYSTNKVVFSPDRINGMLAVITIGMWTFLILYYFFSGKVKLCDWSVIIPVVFAFFALLLIYFRGRSGGFGIYKTEIPEGENGAFINTWEL